MATISGHASIIHVIHILYFICTVRLVPIPSRSHLSDQGRKIRIITLTITFPYSISDCYWCTVVWTFQITTAFITVTSIFLIISSCRYGQRICIIYEVIFSLDNTHAWCAFALSSIRLIDFISFKSIIIVSVLCSRRWWWWWWWWRRDNAIIE